MMKTSYFARYKQLDGISIALSTPKWFSGTTYPELNPTWGILKQYKIDDNKKAYIHAYYNQVLSKLDPEKVFNDLKYNTLLCWEKSGEFCHRRIVAKWIEKHIGVDIPEI